MDWDPKYTPIRGRRLWKTSSLPSYSGDSGRETNLNGDMGDVKRLQKKMVRQTCLVVYFS